MGRMTLLLAALGVAACGGGGGADAGDDVGPNPDGNTAPQDTLETATGCPGVYNPEQVLDLSFEMAAGDLNTIINDLSFTTQVTAQMSCNGGAPITVGIRRKRSGGARKVGFKVDINAIVNGQTFHDLRKLSLENGVSSGTNVDEGDAGSIIGEYLAWRTFTLSGAIAGRAALVTVTINGEAFGVYANVEQPDKRFLDVRLGDDEGWLYKHSGGEDDGFKTHETDGLEDPYGAYLCFWDRGCSAPSADDLAANLPTHLDIPQMLRMGAVNAIIKNTDSPIFKDNNYYWYDWAGGGRIYLPWDLDTAWRNTDFHVIDAQTSQYTTVLYTNWRDDYAAIVRELLETRLTVAAIHAEIDRVVRVSSAAFAADPYIGGGADGAGTQLRGFWTDRHAQALAEAAQ